MGKFWVSFVSIFYEKNYSVIRPFDCIYLSLSLSRATADEVPLGEPLSNTVLDVRDEEGQSIESGLGQLHIGEAN